MVTDNVLIASDIWDALEYGRGHQCQRCRRIHAVHKPIRAPSEIRTNRKKTRSECSLHKSHQTIEAIKIILRNSYRPYRGIRHIPSQLNVFIDFCYAIRSRKISTVAKRKCTAARMCANGVMQWAPSRHWHSVDYKNAVRLPYWGSSQRFFQLVCAQKTRASNEISHSITANS